MFVLGRIFVAGPNLVHRIVNKNQYPRSDAQSRSRRGKRKRPSFVTAPNNVGEQSSKFEKCEAMMNLS